MKLPDVLLLGLTVMFLIIGLDQTIVLGFARGYWAFMLALVPFFVFNYRKSRKNSATSSTSPQKTPKNRKKGV
jgi:hypothetical protein